MGYLHDKLKEAIGLVDSKSSIIREWTPNNIKTLIIGKHYMLVVHHIGGFNGHKIVKLDESLLLEDMKRLAKNGGNPKLNTILKKRSLSCLEEFYVDSIYIGFPVIVDIMGYVEELVKTTSRLRYFGYGEFPLESSDWINKSYISNKQNFDYSLATDNNRPFNLEFRNVGYKDWYKNYYLRPQFYEKDKENGKLSLHFKKFENDYKSYLLSKNKEDSIKNLEVTLKEIVCVNDKNNIVYLKKFDMLLSHLTKYTKDEVVSYIFNICKNRITKREPVEGLTKELVLKTLKDCNDRDYLLKSYERYGVISKENTTLNKDKLQEYIRQGKGFINIQGILDDICLESTKVLINEGYKDLVGMSLYFMERDIPCGNFRDTFIKKQSDSKDLNGYFKYLGELIGVLFFRDGYTPY